MAVFVNESFTAADGTDVDTLTGWDEHTLENAGQFTITSNRARQATASSVLEYNTADPASADYDVTAVIYCASALAGAKIAIWGRLDTATLTGYSLLYRTNDATFILQRINSGRNTDLGTYVQGALTPGNSYTVKLEMIGSDIKVYVDGTVRIAATDTTAPITAKGKVGIEGFGVATTGSTGYHFDALTATDSAAPTSTISYVGVGAAAITPASATLNPALPAGLAVDDYMIVTAWERSNSGGYTGPSGWTQIATVSLGGGKSRTWARFYQSGDAAPAVGITSNSTGGITQVAAFRGVDKTTPVDVVGAGAPVAATSINDIGPITGITPTVNKALVLVMGYRHRDWGSVATLTGDSLTWNEIAEPDSVGPLIGLVWDYAIFAGAPTAIADKTFTITTPGATALWAGQMLSLRPATTVTGPATRQGKFRSAGSFSAGKPFKRRVSGAFGTKPLKVIGIDQPPPPPPVGPPADFTLSTAGDATASLPMTFTPQTPTSQPIFPVISAVQPQVLSYQFHQPPPTEQGMKVMMWDSLQNMQKLSESDLAAMKSWGIDGFHLMGGAFVGAGGANPPNPTAFPTNLAWAQNFANTHPEFDVQFGVQARNYYEAFTPWAPFWNQNLYDDVIFPGFDTVGQAIKNSALTGVTVDGEDYGASAQSYPQGSGTIVPTGDHTTGLPDGGTAAIVNGDNAREGWRWKTHFGEDGRQKEGGNRGAPAGYTEATVRAKLRSRAVEIANVLATAANATTANPCKFTEYHLYHPGGYWEHEQIRVNKNETTGEFISEEYIDGLTSDSRIQFRFIDSMFYKSPGDDASYKENLNGIEDPTHPAGPYNSVAHPGTTFSWQGIGWENQVFGGRPNAFVEPFIWITGGPKCNFGFGATADCQRPDSYITTQLQQARKWTQGGEITLYNTATFPTGLTKYNTAIQAALKAASA